MVLARVKRDHAVVEADHIDRCGLARRSPIAEFALIKGKVGQMVIDCYAAESVVNMVAGLIDGGYEDYAVEAAVSKVLASEALTRTADEALQIAGGIGFMRELKYERVVRDARGWQRPSDHAPVIVELAL